MWVQMLLTISGGRHDGTQWPPRGWIFEIGDAEGRDLVAGGMAVQVAPPAPPKPVAKPEPAPEPVAKPADDRPVADEMPQPSPTDPKAAWVEYAVSRGAARSEAQAQTQKQLQLAYGGRL